MSKIRNIMQQQSFCDVLRHFRGWTGHRCSGTTGTLDLAHHTPRRLNDDTAEPPFLSLRAVNNVYTILFSWIVFHFRAGERVPTERAGSRAHMCTGNFGWERKDWDHGGDRSCGVWGYAKQACASNCRIRSVMALSVRVTEGEWAGGQAGGRVNGRPCGRAHGQARMRADRRCPVGGTDERIALHGLVQAYYWNIPTQTNRSLDQSVPATFIFFGPHPSP